MEQKKTNRVRVIKKNINNIPDEPKAKQVRPRKAKTCSAKKPDLGASIKTPVKRTSKKQSVPVAKTIQLLNSDCILELNKMEDNSIDCVITDPPYFIDKLDNKWSASDIAEEKKNSHVTHLPKGMRFDKNQVKNLYDYYLKLSKILFKKMKPGGYFLSFSSPRLYHAIAMSCEIAGFEIRDMINWTYTQSMPKGMSILHLIDKLNVDIEEKDRLKNEYKDFKTPQIKSCFRTNLCSNETA